MATEIPINDYIDFFMENNGTIYMKPDEVGTYSLNQDNIDTWITNIEEHQKYRTTCDERIKVLIDKIETLETKSDKTKQDKLISYYQEEIAKLSEGEYCDVTDNTEVYLEFADAFRNTMRYVTFDEMLSIINHISIEIRELVTNHNYNKIYLLVDEESKSSNTWISLLYIGELIKNNFFTPEVTKKTVLIQKADTAYTYSTENPEESILVLHIDDMSYSGRQLSYALEDSALQNKNLNWYLTITFIGSSAISLFKQMEIYKYLKFFRNTDKVDTFVEQAKNYLLTKYSFDKATKLSREISDLCSATPQGALKNGYGYGEGAFYCRDQNIPIYFDHKVADTVSTFQKLLYTGAWPTSPDHCYNLPLINGCQVTLASYDNKACYTKAELDILNQYTCPPTFYKRPGFGYKYNGKIIDRDLKIVDAIISCSDGTGKEDSTVDDAVKLMGLPPDFAKSRPMESIIQSLRDENPNQLTGAVKVLGIDFETIANLANPETNSTTNEHLKLHVGVLRHRLQTGGIKGFRGYLRKIRRAQDTILDFATGITMDGKMELVPNGTISMLSRLVVTSHGWKQQLLQPTGKIIDMYYLKNISETPEHDGIPFPGETIGKSYIIQAVKVNKLIEWIDRVGQGNTDAKSSSNKSGPPTGAFSRAPDHTSSSGYTNYPTHTSDKIRYI